ncbi:MAG: carboxypeptidase regulatory-like domain-containing protein, partial [Candidatus Zophobacter franzmannii]|nr:carboxypeptidase regulatory-like domain-containing protein [Candidatus Zophobacter franzmannii]
MKKCVLFYLLLIFAMSIFAQNTGGPDTFGYTYINSLEPTGPTFSWITPSTTNEVTGLSDDSFVGSFPIGFNFSFYDSVYDQIFVGSNGLIGFDSASMNTLSNSPIPTAGIPNSQIFWCWDDLNPTYTWANSAIYYENTTVDQMNAFVMSFISYSEYGGSTAPDDCIDVQIILFANGDIKIQYQNIGTGFDLTNCTVGIENEDGLDGLQYLFNNTGAPLQNDLVISFMRPVAYPDDLRAMSINGNMTPTSGTNSSYTVSVLNRGSNDADNYSVKLMQFVDGVNDIELTSATGTLMSPNTTEDYIFNYTFNTVSEFQVYGYVDYAADLAPVDNSTSLFDVSVQPVGTAICTIGDESVLNNMVPFNFYYQSSLTQTMLYPDEITVGGLIMGIDFHVNWQSELINQNMNIWIGESVLADLSGGFIPASDLTPAFASTFSLTNGDYYVHLDFDTPYAYNGGNLVLMYQRPLGTQMNSSSDRWYCSTSAYPNRTIELHDNTTEYDPNLAQVGNVLDLVPNIRLYFVTSGLGALEGVATDNGAPLANVDIVVQGTNYQTMTDGNGFYAFPYLPANDYVIEANIHGYYESTINITITEDVITTGDIAMITLPVCSVSGQVIASGTMTGIPGTCYLNGYDYYEVDTDANGFFTFTGVYCDQTYQLTLNSLGYSTSSQDVVVNTADVDLGQIVLQEIAFAVNGVIAEELDTDEALLTWSPPVSSGTGGAWVYKDNGVNSDGIGLTDGGTFEVATKYEVNELSIYAGFYLNSMRFFLQSPATSVVLKIYSGNNGDVLLHEQAVPTYNDSDWNEVQLTTSIPITGQTPLWFGYEVSHTPADRPAGCDAGPHQPGGDMIKTTTVWEELHIVASTLDYNWNLQA